MALSFILYCPKRAWARVRLVACFWFLFVLWLVNCYCDEHQAILQDSLPGPSLA